MRLVTQRTRKSRRSLHREAAARQRSCGISGDRGSRLDVPGHDRRGANYCIFTNRHAAEDRCTATDAGAALHDGRDCFPIVIGLQATFGGGCARNFIVDEDDAMPDKDLIFNLDAFADESVAGDFAPAADAGPLLNFDEGADPAFVADFAAVKIYEVVDDDVAAELYVRRNYTKLSRHYRDLRSNEICSEKKKLI
jgi:hypothetical protein